MGHTYTKKISLFNSFLGRHLIIFIFESGSLNQDR